GLARALLHPADRIAWLALLRAPWCGATWADLEALCGRDRDRSVWDLLQDAAALERLSTDGQLRVRRVRDVLAVATAERGSRSFAAWLATVWRRLGGERLAGPEERAAAESFFTLVSRHMRDGRLDDPGLLE